MLFTSKIILKGTDKDRTLQNPNFYSQSNKNNLLSFIFQKVIDCQLQVKQIRKEIGLRKELMLNSILTFLKKKKGEITLIMTKNQRKNRIKNKNKNKNKRL